MEEHVMLIRRWRVLGGLLALSLAAGTFPASVSAFDAQQWSPAVDPQGFYSVYSSSTSPATRFYVGAWYSYAKDPFILDLGEFRGGFGAGGVEGGGDAPFGLLGPLHVVTDPVTTPLGEATDRGLSPLLCALLPLTDPLANPVVDPLQDCPGGVGGVGAGATGINTNRIKLVERLHQGNFVASFSILDWLEVGVDVPVAYIETDFPGAEEGFGIDDIRVLGKVQALDNTAGG